jgi:hypothetical protein
MLDEIFDLIAYEPEEILKIVAGIVGVLIVLGLAYAVFIAPLMPAPAVVTPSVIPTPYPTAPPVTVTPSPLPDNTGYIIANGDPVYYQSANGSHLQLIGYINKTTPAVYAPFLYGYDDYGDPRVSPDDIPAYVKGANGYFTKQGYYNATLGVFVYYFADTYLTAVVAPTVSPNQSTARASGNYALTGETTVINGVTYAKDSLGYWVEVTNYTLSPVSIYTIVNYPNRAGDLNINWHNQNRV